MILTATLAGVMSASDVMAAQDSEFCIFGGNG